MSHFRVVMADYDSDLFAPPDWIGPQLAQEGIEWLAYQKRSPEAVVEVARDADMVIVQSVRPLLTGAVLAQLPRCRCVVRLGIGYDSVDVTTATQLGILVCNAPGFCTEDVAEHALALLLNGVRHIARQDRLVREGRWERSGALPSVRMKGRTLGFVSFGSIARALAELVKGFNMTLLAYDPYLSAEVMARYGVRKVELDELLRQADYISVHTPLSQDTYHLLGASEFDLMKPGVVLVNTSRGSIIDETALVRAMRSGKVWAAGLDVFEQEPLPLDSPLRLFDTITMTPHVAASSDESVCDLYRICCQIVMDVRDGRWPASVVNPEVAGRARFPFQPPGIRPLE